MKIFTNLCDKIFRQGFSKESWELYEKNKPTDMRNVIYEIDGEDYHLVKMYKRDWERLNKRTAKRVAETDKKTEGRYRRV